MSIYEEEEFHGHFVNALKWNWPYGGKERLKIVDILPNFKIYGKTLFYNFKSCVPRKSVSTILGIAHNANIRGVLKFANGVLRLLNYQLHHKSRYAKYYINVRQRWGWIETAFIVLLQKTKDGYYVIKTWIILLIRAVHFLKSPNTCMCLFLK